ncbi:MAG: hypothetical protein Q9195_008741 [Heterodermia aff. obscurata]
MTRFLLTGGSGFIAAHVLDILLERGHSVVTTVRSLQKAQAIKEAHPTYDKDRLDFAIVEDIAQPEAIIGTTGILKAIKKNAPSVKRVVITSSFAAVVDRSKTVGKIYSEADWNPMTEAEAYEGPANGYRASKTFAVSHE